MPDFSYPQWLVDSIERIKAWLSEPYLEGIGALAAILSVFLIILTLPKRSHNLIKRMLFGAFVGAAPYLVIAALQLRQSISAGQPAIPALTIRQALVAMIIPSIFFAFANRMGIQHFFLMVFVMIGAYLIWFFFKLNTDSPTLDAIIYGCESGFFLGGAGWLIWIIKKDRPFMDEISAEDKDSSSL